MKENTPYKNLYKTAYWLVLVLAVGAFYISLRTDRYQLEYTLAALGLWGGAYLINRLIKKQN